MNEKLVTIQPKSTDPESNKNKSLERPLNRRYFSPEKKLVLITDALANIDKDNFDTRMFTNIALRDSIMDDEEIWQGNDDSAVIQKIQAKIKNLKAYVAKRREETAGPGEDDKKEEKAA